MARVGVYAWCTQFIRFGVADVRHRSLAAVPDVRYRMARHGCGGDASCGRARGWVVGNRLLALYGYVGCMLFGVFMNLYSWPFSAGIGGLGWQPGSSLSQTLRQYWLFYVTTSLTWDTLRGCSTAAFIRCWANQSSKNCDGSVVVSSGPRPDYRPLTTGDGSNSQ